MRTKILLVAAFAAVFGLASCSKSDPKSNYDEYQKTVNNTVKSQKKNSKAILLVAFGSTWQQAYDAFDATVAAYKSIVIVLCPF